jgi:lipopolysaccharide transport system permease protein
MFMHVARLLWRNIIILGHNIVIFPLVLLFIWQPLTWVALLFIPGFILLVINLAWITLFLGILCARYRDLSPIINSMLQILFYLTPIMWMPDRLSQRAGSYLIDFNPLYHLIAVIRAPLLGQAPSELSWIVSSGVALFGWAVTLIIYSRYQRRIAYWL